MATSGFIFFLMALFSFALIVVISFATIDENDTGAEGFKPLGTFVLNIIVGIVFMVLLSSATAWWIFVFGPAVCVHAFNLGRKIFSKITKDADK
jgi:uncharacterized BrkB/YihY/UPF0761 family membrane protein